MFTQWRYWIVLRAPQPSFNNPLRLKVNRIAGSKYGHLGHGQLLDGEKFKQSTILDKTQLPKIINLH